MIFFTEWFQIQREFATPFEEMSPPELNKCLQKFYLSARKTRRQFLQQKITYSDQSRVGSSLEKSSVFQAIFYCWRQSEWFQIQREFATPFEEMSPPELNKCLQKFYLSARKRDGSF